MPISQFRYAIAFLFQSRLIWVLRTELFGDRVFLEI